MVAPNNVTPLLRDLVQEDEASAEQILANALQLYAALPTAGRAAALEVLRSSDQAAHEALAREVARAVLVVHLRQRRDAIRDQGRRGLLPPLPSGLQDMSDDELGAEAVRLVKESRVRRAASHGA